MNTIPPDQPDEQNKNNSLSGTAMSVIVLAVLDFFRPTIFGSSWTPWFRALIAITVLTVAIVVVILAVKLAWSP